MIRLLPLVAIICMQISSASAADQELSRLASVYFETMNHALLNFLMREAVTDLESKGYKMIKNSTSAITVKESSRDVVFFMITRYKRTSKKGGLRTDEFIRATLRVSLDKTEFIFGGKIYNDQDSDEYLHSHGIAPWNWNHPPLLERRRSQ